MPFEYINKNKIQWIPSNAGTIGTTAVCPEYGGICISEASGIFPVGMAICTCAVEHYKYKSPFQSPPLLFVGKKG